MTALPSEVQLPLPVQERDRADVLDALRGFALLGIFISHVPGFSGFTFMPLLERSELNQFGIDGTLEWLFEFLIRGKFYSLFSLLFGIGFAVQLESATRRGSDFKLRFARRLSILLVIGFVHSLLWYGDILKDYALIGFVLILTAHRRIATVAWVAAGVLVCRIFWPVLVFYLVPVLAPLPAGSNPSGSFIELTRSFESTELITIFAANFELLGLKAMQMIYNGKAISVLFMFLLGSLIGRLQLYRNLTINRLLFWRVLFICAPIGIIGNAILVHIHPSIVDYPPSGLWVIERALFAFAVPTMALAYASAFALLWSHGLRRLLSPLASVGRMALTTYVSQSLIGVALFYGIGLGLRGSISLVEGTFLAIAIFSLQVLISSRWLRVFQFGPLEWAWRRATYGVPIPILRTV